MSKRNGLLLTGGGARAAYQVGVIRAVAEVYPGTVNPFPVMTGISAGAINAVLLASYADDFKQGAERLWSLWENLKTDDVFKSDSLSLTRIGMRWLGDLVLGGIRRRPRATFLLDSSPLRAFLAANIDFERMHRNLENRTLYSVGFSATNFKTGTAITFFDTHENIPDWIRSTRMSVREKISLDHIVASSALPIFFGPVGMKDSFYGDGGIRLSTPLSPAIHLGAETLFAVGIRHPRSTEAVKEMNLTGRMASISMVDVAGTVMNSIFLDSLEADLERMERINRTLEMMPEDLRAKHPNGLRTIPTLAIQPTEDLGNLASKHFDEFPQNVRYLLRGLGASSVRGSDLLSYLAFEGVFTRELMNLGYRDAIARADAIRKFFAQ